MQAHEFYDDGKVFRVCSRTRVRIELNFVSRDVFGWSEVEITICEFGVSISDEVFGRSEIEITI